jgi:magnesium transporter
MLVFHECAGTNGDTITDFSAASISDAVVWVDMLQPTPDEVAFVEKTTGLVLPTLADLTEIESSSRLYTDKGALFMSTPLVFKSDTAFPEVTPVGFVLTRKRLITIRFVELGSFNAFRERAAKPEGVHRSSAGVFAGLIDTVVDRMADVLEGVGGDLDAISRRIFRDNLKKAGTTRLASSEDADLRAILRRIGRAGDLASTIRDSLLGVSRMIPYITGLAEEWLPDEVKPYLKTLRQDALSLNDYEIHLTNKVQLLLDATLGLINIEQNNIFKVLTIVSVAGIPPTLIASMYGMNFRHMPELDWVWGYPWGLMLIVVSTLIPLAWFKLRGWM